MVTEIELESTACIASALFAVLFLYAPLNVLNPIFIKRSVILVLT